MGPLSIPVAGTMGNISPILETSIPYSDPSENASTPHTNDIPREHDIIPEVPIVGAETILSEKSNEIGEVGDLSSNDPPSVDLDHRSSPSSFLESSPPRHEPIEDFTQYPSS